AQTAFGKAPVVEVEEASGLTKTVADHALLISLLLMVLCCAFAYTEQSEPRAAGPCEKRADYNSFLMISNILCFTSGFVNALAIIDMGMTVSHQTGNTSLIFNGGIKFFHLMAAFAAGAFVSGFTKSDKEADGAEPPTLLKVLLFGAGIFFFGLGGVAAMETHKTWGAQAALIPAAITAAVAGGLIPECFFGPGWKPKEFYGMRKESTGMGDSQLKVKLKMGVDFVGTTGKALFRPECTTPAFLQSYKKVLATVDAYNNEIVWWCNRNPDYIAWSHGNLNVDNVFFWRDAE
ncbi:unnamed protein product, partial [Symbiodinium pilosum]